MKTKEMKIPERMKKTPEREREREEGKYLWTFFGPTDRNQTKEGGRKGNERGKKNHKEGKEERERERKEKGDGGKEGKRRKRVDILSSMGPSG